MQGMPRYDLCLAWNWEYDADFAHLLEAACVRRSLSFLHITPENLEVIEAGLNCGEITFTALLDRASEVDARFHRLPNWGRVHKIFRINPRERADWTYDKANMHPVFVRHGLKMPFTYILPSYDQKPVIPQPDLSRMGKSFAIKPACEGGGIGVILEAVSWDQVLDARKQFPDEKYLLQAHVATPTLDGHPAWFRVLYCAGATYPNWWDPHTHAYARVTAWQRARFGLQRLSEIPRRIAALCHLHLFSTEIALAQDGYFLIVDYINDPVDLRLQSKAADGVPDIFVENIARRLARLVELKRRPA